MPTYRGSCHCGRVTFEVDGDIRGAMECNCSLCRRKGALWHAATADQVRITSGEADLAGGARNGNIGWAALFRISGLWQPILVDVAQ